MPSVGSASLDLVVDKQQVGRSITGAVDGARPAAMSAAKSMAKTFGAAFAATAAFDIGRDAINNARDLAENQSKVNTVFDKMGPAITKYAKAADAIGLSDNAALEAVGTFGNMFDQLGIGSKQSAKMSTSLTNLAADLGSFHNADITEVIAAQSAAFRGEYDSLQRFIPTLNAAAVDQRALAMTHKATTKELTAQDKALAVQQLMLEGAGAAIGDFKRTSGGLANQQRVLGAQWEDMKTKIGGLLIPAMSKLTSLTMGLLSGFQNLPGPVKVALGVFAGVAVALFTVSKAIQAATAAQAAFNAIMALNPVVLVVAAIVALGVAVFVAYQKFQPFRDAVDKVWQLLQAGFHWVQANWPLLLGILTGPIGLAVLAITKNFDSIVSFVKGLPAKISGAASGMWDGIKNAFKSALNWIIDRWNGLDFTLPSISAFGRKIGGFTLGTPDIPRFERGGWVPGAVGAPQLAVVHGGEYVLSNRDVAAMRASAQQPGGGDASSGEIHNHFHNVTERDMPARAGREMRRQLYLAGK